MIAKLNKLHFELFPHLSDSPDLPHSDSYLFENLKKILTGKRYGCNDEVIAETEAYFEGLDK